MATAEATPDQVAEPIPQRSDTTKAVRNVFNRHIAHEGIMLDRMQRQLRNAEKIQRFAATNDVNDLPKPGDDDMGVNIGNEYHLHQIMQPQTEKPMPSTVGDAVKSRVWPIVLAAAMSGGVGAAAPLLYWWLNKPTPQPAAKLPDYQLRLEVKDQP